MKLWKFDTTAVVSDSLEFAATKQYGGLAHLDISPAFRFGGAVPWSACGLADALVDDLGTMRFSPTNDTTAAIATAAFLMEQQYGIDVPREARFDAERALADDIRDANVMASRMLATDFQCLVVYHLLDNYTQHRARNPSAARLITESVLARVSHAVTDTIPRSLAAGTDRVARTLERVGAANRVPAQPFTRMAQSARHLSRFARRRITGTAAITRDQAKAWHEIDPETDVYTDETGDLPASVGARVAPDDDQ